MADTIYRHEAIEAIEHITSSMSVCVNTDECHGMKRMQRQAVIELANLPSVQPTLYGYDVQHLAIIANILERESLSPENVGEILRDASRIYNIVRDEAVKDFNEAVRNCMEKAVKNDG